VSGYTRPSHSGPYRRADHGSSARSLTTGSSWRRLVDSDRSSTRSQMLLSTPTTVEGFDVSEGGRVLLCYPSANRDEEVVSELDRFDTRRLSFSGFYRRRQLPAGLVSLTAGLNRAFARVSTGITPTLLRPPGPT